MKKQNRSFILFIITFLLLGGIGGGTTTAQITFQKTFGGTGNETGYSIQQTVFGGYIIAGRTNSFGAGNYDVYLIRMNAFGDTMWTKTYGGTGNDQGWSVQQTADGGYVIAGLTISFGAGAQDVYLIKTDANGDTLWTKTFGGTGSDVGYSVQQTADGGYVIAGYTNSFGAGSTDVYLIRTDSTGDTLWTRSYGGANDDFAYSVQQTADGGYIITGNTTNFGVGGSDIYLIKTDANGDTLWTKTFGGTSNDSGQLVQQTADEGYIIAGNTTNFGAGGSDFYLIKTDSIGDTLWTKTYGGTSDDLGNSVQQTFDGGYIITGYTNSFGAGFIAAYLIKTDSIGDTLWTKTYGGTSGEFPYSVQQTTDGGYIITGYTGSFGTGGNDIYLIKTDANGNSGGCNESSAATIVGNSATQVGSGAIVGSGGIVNNTATIVSNTATIDSILCSSGCVLPNPAFTYKITSDGSSFEVNFVDSTTNAQSWFWDFGDGFTDTNQSPTHIYTDSLIYNVCLTVSNSCGSDTLCEQVNVWCELPAAGFTNTASGLTVNFLDSSINAASWFWNFGDGFQSTQQDTSHTYSNPGPYKVCLTVSNDCGFDTLCKFIDVYTGVNEFQVSSFKFQIYPNPGRGVFTLSTNYEFNTNIRIMVYDVLGRECLRAGSSRVLGTGERLLEIDLSPYPAGIYHLQLITENGTGNKRIIIE